MCLSLNMTLPWSLFQILRVIKIVALASLSCLMGCGLAAPPPDIRHQEPNVASLDPQNWYIYHSAGIPYNPSTDIEGAWSFNFPSSAGGGHVNYVQTPFNTTTVL